MNKPVSAGIIHPFVPISAVQKCEIRETRGNSADALLISLANRLRCLRGASALMLLAQSGKCRGFGGSAPKMHAIWLSSPRVRYSAGLL
jgi:hypothetical protein